MNNQKFDSLIDKYLKGLLNEQETAHLEKWLDSLEDKSAYDALAKEELDNTRQAMYQQLSTRIDKNKKKIIPVFLKIAAAVIFIIIIGYILAPQREMAVAGTKGGIRKQILSDGSIVWLKGNSKLTFPAAFEKGKREVSLEGEALFEIAKDEKRPFLIYCGTLTTKVLGTSFNIRNNGDETAVSVLTGKVSLTTGSAAEITLYANENAVYSAPQETITKARQPDTAVYALIKGTEYEMTFNDAGMRDVIRKIEQKFNVDIQLVDTAIVNNLITADVTDQSLEKTMEMICQALNLEATFKGQTILLQPKV